MSTGIQQLFARKNVAMIKICGIL